MRYNDASEWFCGCLIAVIAFILVSMVVFTIYDRCTGEYATAYAEVIDKSHEVHHHSSSTKNSNGTTTVRHWTTEEFNISFKRKSGLIQVYDVGGWTEYNAYRVGQPVTVYMTIGGYSKNEYLTGLGQYTGGEVSR